MKVTRLLLRKAQMSLLGGPQQRVHVRAHARTTSTGQIVPVRESDQQRRAGERRPELPQPAKAPAPPMKGGQRWSQLEPHEQRLALDLAKQEGLESADVQRLLEWADTRGKDRLPRGTLEDRLRDGARCLPLRRPHPGGSQKRQIEEVEDQIRGRTHEHMGLWIGGQFYSSGPATTEEVAKARGRSMGSASACVVPPEALNLLRRDKIRENNNVLTHNHPGPPIPFSTADLRMAIAFNLAEIRAVTSEGTWVMRRPGHRWPIGMHEVWEQAEKGARKYASAKMVERIAKAGGNVADGKEAAGYSPDHWARWYSAALAHLWDRHRGTSPPLEHEPRGGARARSADRDVAGVRPDREGRRPLMKARFLLRRMIKGEQLKLFGGPTQEVDVKAHTRVTRSGKVVPVKASHAKRKKAEPEGGPHWGRLSRDEQRLARELLEREGLPPEQLERLVTWSREHDPHPDSSASARLTRSAERLPFVPPDTAAPFEQQLAHVEDQIRGRTHEHMGLWVDGVFHQSGPLETEDYLQRIWMNASTRSVCVIPPPVQSELVEHGGRLRGRHIVLTHNHPSGSPFSTQDIALAQKLDAAEIRAATRTGTWVIRRPDEGWTDELLGLHQMMMKAAGRKANDRMTAHILEQGGNPDDGPQAKGYSDALYRRFRTEAIVERWPQYALPPMQFVPVGAASTLSKGRVILLRKARSVSVRPHMRGGHIVRGHTRQLVGTTWPAPEHHGGDFTVHDVQDGIAEVRHADGQRAFMPAESVEHYSRDLRAHLDHPPTSGDHAVDHVLEGGGQFVGKGNDGLVWRSHDEAVKASTTVPYQPRNPGHRTPAEAVEHLRNEHVAHEALGDLPHVPPVRGLEHDGRYWLAKPWLESPGRISRQELDEVAHTIYEMHARGWTLGDTVQLGRDAKGHLQLMDLGQAHPGAQEHEKRNDLERLDWLYHEHGEQRIPRGTQAERRLRVARQLLDLALDKGDRALTQRAYDRWRELHESVSADAVLEEDPELTRWTALQDELDEVNARMQRLQSATART